MENDNKQNQEGNSKKETEGVLQLLQPHDMSKTVESAMHVFQGRHEKLPELLHDVGNLVLKGARKMTTPQLILAAGAATIGAILVARFVSNQHFSFEED